MKTYDQRDRFMKERIKKNEFNSWAYEYYPSFKERKTDADFFVHETCFKGGWDAALKLINTEK